MIDPSALPIPTDPGTAAVLGPLVIAMGIATLGVLIWQAVRYFRDHRDDD